MLELLAEPANLPYAVSLAVMLVLAVLQIVGLGDLLGGDADVDGDVDAGLLSILGIGRIPFLMWLMLLLATFGLLGLGIQQILSGFLGESLGPWTAAPVSAVAALLTTGGIARPLGRILPRDETTAIDLSALVGRQAEILVGTAKAGSPARARVSDHFGHPHNVMVEPDNADQQFVTGEMVLLVRREGEIFRAIARGDHYLPRLD